MFSESSVESHVDCERMRQTVRFLYEGPHGQPTVPMSARCEFHDPLVMVRGKERLLSMFRKLNRIYPASSVEVFEPLTGSNGKYALSVHYRRQASAKAAVFLTEIEFTFEGEEIIQITEDWQQPFKLSGRGTSLLNRGLRVGLGRLFS